VTKRARQKTNRVIFLAASPRDVRFAQRAAEISPPLTLAEAGNIRIDALAEFIREPQSVVREFRARSLCSPGRKFR
jgi:hypothetical protein